MRVFRLVLNRHPDYSSDSSDSPLPFLPICKPTYVHANTTLHALIPVRSFSLSHTDTHSSFLSHLWSGLCTNLQPQFLARSPMCTLLYSHWTTCRKSLRHIQVFFLPCLCTCCPLLSVMHPHHQDGDLTSICPSKKLNIFLLEAFPHWMRCIQAVLLLCVFIIPVIYLYWSIFSHQEIIIGFVVYLLEWREPCPT